MLAVILAAFCALLVATCAVAAPIVQRESAEAVQSSAPAHHVFTVGEIIGLTLGGLGSTFFLIVLTCCLGPWIYKRFHRYRERRAQRWAEGNNIDTARAIPRFPCPVTRCIVAMIFPLLRFCVRCTSNRSGNNPANGSPSAPTSSGASTNTASSASTLPSPVPSTFECPTTPAPVYYNDTEPKSLDEGIFTGASLQDDFALPPPAYNPKTKAIGKIEAGRGQQ